MSSRSLSLLVLLLTLPLWAGDAKTLKVCADPNNLPFSNQREEGFENRLAHLVAEAMGAKLEFVWWSARKALVKYTLNEGRCDVLMGVAATLDSAAVTQPYYRSAYVFVSRKDRDLQLVSLNDQRLEKWRIGLHMAGEDYTPPAFALARRGITANVAGYPLFSAFGEQNPPARLIDAVAAGDVDVAIVWGPFAGYFARSAKAPLDITPVTPEAVQGIPFTFDISMAVKEGNDTLRAELDQVLQRKCAEVQALLKEYGVPTVRAQEGRPPCDRSRQSLASWR